VAVPFCTARQKDAPYRGVWTTRSYKEHFMTAARGDSKPCTHPGCTGKMHFKREGSNLRWVCDQNVQHQ
jgi:hypothetical protein